jgi:hypothetical protein
MSIPTDVHSAVVALCEPTADPALTDPEIDGIIAATAGYRVWTPNTTYPAGVLVIPTVATGWAYRPISMSLWNATDIGFTDSVLPGTSGATEPTWTVPYDSRNPSAYVTDGTITWAASVPADGPYNIKRAAAECWRAKARKCVMRVDSSIPGGPSAKESQMYQMLMDQADRLEPVALY